MPIDPTPENLIKVQTELTVVRAQHDDLTLKVRRGELVDRAKLEAVVFALAHRARDQLLTAPARHGAILAAEFGLAPAALVAALDRLMRGALTDLARHPPTQHK